MKKQILSLALAFSIFSAAQATEGEEAKKTEKSVVKATSTKSTKEGEEKKEDEGKFTISGYLDSYYFTNFNNPLSRDNMGQSGVGRGFDRRVDQFQLGMVQTVFKYTNGKSEAVADLAYGPSAVYGNYGNIGTSHTLIASYYGTPLANDAASALIIKQAYFKYNVTEKLSFTAGQFGTHIGYEYIDAPLNFHYSINHTFNSGIPFYHTGLKGSYVFNEKATLMLGVVNGFDYVHDNNRNKSIIGQLLLTPAEGLNIAVNYYRGNEASSDTVGGAYKTAPDGVFSVYDLTATYQVSDNLMLGTWLMLGEASGKASSWGAAYDLKEKANWGGANLYAVYKFTDIFSLGFRGEYFDNTGGVRGFVNKNVQGQLLGADCFTYTLTGNVKLADGHLLLKPEFRFDDFKKVEGDDNKESQQFMDSEGKYTKSTQATLGMAAIYTF